MRSDLIKRACAGALLAAGVACAFAADERPVEHPVVKRPFDLPPSADLRFDLQARQRGFALGGEALITWRAGGGRYQVVAESRVPILGKITENRSQGAIDSFGLAPGEFYEKRFRKDATTSTFNRATRTLSFSEGDQTYPLLGGEQDRASVTWQLVAVVRAAAEKVKPGAAWTFFVAGRRDADAWTFRFVKREKLHTGIGDVETVHLSRDAPVDAKGQALDIWLAPAHAWYPVRIRFTDDNDYVEQTLATLTKK